MYCSTNAKEHFILEKCKILPSWDVAQFKDIRINVNKSAGVDPNC